MSHIIAVIDIGMTNKKVAIYEWPDSAGQGVKPHCLASVSRTFEPVMLGDIETHDLAGMEDWFLEMLADFAERYPIRAIAVSTHGATMVCLGADGKPCLPCVYYTYEPGPEFQKRFYDLTGKPEALQAVTGTPVLSALINPAKGLLFAKERFPEQFARTELVLSYPQYWGYRLSGAAGAEGTYVGCHTYLWDWQKEEYSSVARVLGLADKMPSPLRKSQDILGRLKPELAARLGLDASTIVTMGIHDSNASLVPHIVARGGRDFVLNSTGTWCVLMHPCPEYGFKADELGKVVFFNRSAFLKPVKTAIFLGGFEYGTYTDLIAKTSSPVPACSDPSVYARIVREKRLFILPEIVPGSGQFPGSSAMAVEGGTDFPLATMESGEKVPAFFSDPETAGAVLNLSLAVQTLVALGRTGLEAGSDVFTEGGFRKNPDYCGILAAALPGNATWITDLAEATSFGAAMTAASALSGRPLEDFGSDFDIEYKSVRPMEGLDGFADYMEAMLGLVARRGGRVSGI